jgi:hypothetical protein
MTGFLVVFCGLYRSARHPSARVRYCGWQPGRRSGFRDEWGPAAHKASRAPFAGDTTNLTSTTSSLWPSLPTTDHHPRPSAHTAAVHESLLPSLGRQRGSTISFSSQRKARHPRLHTAPPSATIHVHPSHHPAPVRIPLRPSPRTSIGRAPLSHRHRQGIVGSQTVRSVAVETELCAALLPLQVSLPVAPLSHRALLASLTACLSSLVIH